MEEQCTFAPTPTFKGQSYRKAACCPICVIRRVTEALIESETDKSLTIKVVEPCTICSLRNAGSLVTFVLIIQLEYESQFTLFGEAPAGTSRGLEMLSRARGSSKDVIDFTPWRYDDLDNDK